MENYIIIKHIEDFKTRIHELSSAIKIDNLKSELANLELKMNEANFWSDQANSSKVLKDIKIIKEKIATIAAINSHLDDLKIYFEMHQNGEAGLLEEIEDIIDKISEELSSFEIKTLVSKEYDFNDAIIEMHPGAGGTESQDWTEMLFRMYKRYCERNNYKIEILDYQDGEEAGIKSVTFIVKGEYAYGYLRSEKGVHRLIRISPFDSNARRHTSFCSVNIYPSINENINIEIKQEEIRVDTFRASGAGGQHVNTTDSAIRITHLKTGIVVSCQNERSQIQNREKALQVLKSKLYQLEFEEQNKKIKELTGETSENAFGSQIRTYTFHPYSLVKDHRINYEVGNINAVMDGEIDGFINAYLKSPYN